MERFKFVDLFAGIGSFHLALFRLGGVCVLRKPNIMINEKKMTFAKIAIFIHQTENKMQNTTHAVMAQRHEPMDSLDDFPTPPWATRALIEHIIGKDRVVNLTCLEPAAGRGFMARPLSEYFATVDAADTHCYGYAVEKDFLTFPYEASSYDWVITNLPFRLAELFINRAMTVARRGVAILARTVFLESISRYKNIFKNTPPSHRLCLVYLG